MFKKYDAYKESGVEWIGEIPKGWEIGRIKDFILSIGSGVTPRGGSEVYVKRGVPFLRSQNVYNDGLRLKDVSYIDEETNLKMSNSQVKPLDILINITGASIGRTCIVPRSVERANINQHIIYLRFPVKYIDFFSWFLKADIISDFIIREQTGSSREALNMGQLLNLEMIIPPLPEQKAIANYLDKETQRIDQKIKLYQQKIKAYQDLRKATINKAVTQGLDKMVKLKTSNIEGIGEVPEHWEIRRVKDLFKISRGRVIAKTELKDDGLYPVYSSQTKNNGVLGYINTFDFNTDLITWTTDGVNAGTVFKRQGKFSCTNICGMLKPMPGTDISLDYFTYCIAESTKHNKRIDTNGAKIMSNEMAFIKIPVPPLQEQQEIVSYLAIKTGKLDQIIQTLKKQIKVQKEYRKSLIDSVVTGRIKVV